MTETSSLAQRPAVEQPPPGASVLEHVFWCIYQQMFEETAASGIVDEIAGGDVDTLYSWNRALSSIRTAAWQTNEAVELEVIRELRGDAIRIDDFIVYVTAEKPQRRVKDVDALYEYLELGTSALLVFRTTDLSLNGIRAVAQQKGDDPEEIVDRFIEWLGEEGPPKLKMSRMEYAPWWALKMKPGDRASVESLIAAAREARKS